jgi:hypothetical protein
MHDATKDAGRSNICGRQILRRLEALYQPQGHTERFLVGQLASIQLSMERAESLERRAIAADMCEKTRVRAFKQIAQLHKRLQRSWLTVCKDLEITQRARVKEQGGNRAKETVSWPVVPESCYRYIN